MTTDLEFLMIERRWAKNDYEQTIKEYRENPNTLTLLKQKVAFKKLQDIEQKIRNLRKRR